MERITSDSRREREKKNASGGIYVEKMKEARLISHMAHGKIEGSGIKIVDIGRICIFRFWVRIGEKRREWHRNARA